MGQPALLSKPARPLSSMARWFGNRPSSQGQEHGVEFQTLGGVQRQQRDAVGAIGLGGFHHQRDVFEEARHVREFLHRADEFLEVFQSPGGVGRAGFCHISV